MICIVFFNTIIGKIIFYTLHPLLVNMKKILLSMSLVGYMFMAQAQSKNDWFKGEILLTSGERLEGSLVYANDVEVVSVKLPEGIQKSFGNVQLQSFEFLDTKNQRLRRFKTNTLPENGRMAVVEVVLEGEVEVVRCFKMSKKNYARSFYNHFPLQETEHSFYRYYVHDGVSLTTLEHFLKKKYRHKSVHWRGELELFRLRNDLDNGVSSWLKTLSFFNILQEDWRRQQKPIMPRDSLQWARQVY